MVYIYYLWKLRLNLEFEATSIDAAYEYTKTHHRFIRYYVKIQNQIVDHETISIKLHHAPELLTKGQRSVKQFYNFLQCKEAYHVQYLFG